MLYVNKEPQLLNPLLKGLLKYWPNSNSIKERHFIDELKDLLDCFHINSLEFYINKICKRVAKVLVGEHL